MSRNAANTIQAVLMGCAASCLALAVLWAGTALGRYLVTCKGCRVDRYGLDTAVQELRESRAAVDQASKSASAYSDLASQSTDPLSRRNYAELSAQWRNERRLQEEKRAACESDVKNALARLIRYERAELANPD